MASIEKRSETSYRITVSCGYDQNGKKLRKYKTITLPANMTEKQKEKEVQKQAILFEKEVENGKKLNEVQLHFKQFLQSSGFDISTMEVKHLQELTVNTQGFIKQCIGG